MEPTNKTVNDVVDISLAITKKKKFRIDGDDNRILELNTSDLGIVQRIAEAIPKLKALQENAVKLSSSADGTPDMNEENIDEVAGAYINLGNSLKDVDKEMRALVDYIFDSNVSEIAAPEGTMYDLFNGVCRYEHIITTLMGLYEENLQAEYSRVESRMKMHTKKYNK